MSWNAYVCTIKGFCGEGAKRKAAYTRIYGENKMQKENTSPQQKKNIQNRESTRIIREVFFRSSEAELSEILAPNGERVVVAVWKKNVKEQKNPVSFQQFLESFRNANPDKRVWTPKDFLPSREELPTYDVPPSDFPSSPPHKTPSLPQKETVLSNNEKQTSFCPDYITEYIRVYGKNNPKEVEKLERFLRDEEGMDIVVDGFYSLEDNEKVKHFQQKYAEDILAPLGLSEPTGNVYAKTMQKINALHCSS